MCFRRKPEESQQFPKTSPPEKAILIIAQDRAVPAKTPEREVAMSLLTLAIVAPFAAGPPPQANNASIERLRRSVGTVLVDAKIPGVGIALVSREGEIWVGGVGKADLAANRDVDADTVFRIGSSTKSFVALALLKLAE